MPTLLDARLRYCPACPISDESRLVRRVVNKLKQTATCPVCKAVYEMNRTDTTDARKLAARLRQARSRAARLLDDASGKVVKK